MPTPELLQQLRAAYQRWHDTRGQSVAEWIAMMADDVKLRSVADGAAGMKFSAPRDGKQAAHDYFSALAEEWEMVYHAAEEFMIEGNRIVVFGRCAFKHLGTGKTAETPIIHRWTFRDGLVAEYYEYYDTARAFAAATPDAAQV